MQAWLNLDYARVRADELVAEAARSRLVRSIREPRASLRRRVARALLAFGFFFIGVGRSVGAGEEVSDGACAAT